ncbi:unnamed protein product, partial [Linum tenue]
HVDRLVEGFQLRVFPSGPESAYQHVRKFYGLRALADAVRPKRRRVVVKTGVGRGGSSSVAVGDIGVSVAQPPPVQPMAAPADVSGRRGSKRVAEKTALGQASQRAKASSPPRKAAGRGKGVKRGEEQSSIEVSTQAATDGEAAEFALHTISDHLVMPSEYTPSALDSHRRLAETASRFFFSAQIGFSQVILLNDRLSRTVEDNAVEIAKLKKSADEGRETMMGKLRPQVKREFEERLAKKEEELLAEKGAVKAVGEERDRFREKALKSAELEKTLLEEQEALRTELAALKIEKATWE